MSFWRKILGDRGETIACRALKKRGYKVLKKNYRTKLGEIDIIGLEGETIVFIEVKTRTSDKYGSAADAVDIHKQKRIRKIAASFLLKYKLRDKMCRFDVVCIDIQQSGKPIVEIMQNVF